MSNRPIDFHGPAFVHERWSDLPDGQLVAICRDGLAAEELAKALARRSAPQQSYVVTDTSAGSQFVWTKERVQYVDEKRAGEAA